MNLDEVSPLAPISIVVTPTGQWLTPRNPDFLDETMIGNSQDEMLAEDEWSDMKRAIFGEYRGRHRRGLGSLSALHRPSAPTDQ